MTSAFDGIRMFVILRRLQGGRLEEPAASIRLSRQQVSCLGAQPIAARRRSRLPYLARRSLSWLGALSRPDTGPTTLLFRQLASFGGRGLPSLCCSNRSKGVRHDRRRPRALHAKEFQRVHGRPVCVAGSFAGQARNGTPSVLGFAGGHPRAVRADGCGRRRKAGIVAEPPALSAGRGRMRARGADAERRLRRPRPPLSAAHRLLRDAAAAAYRRRPEGDGARL